MRFSGSLLSSFILFVSSFSPFGKVLSQIVATFLGLWKCGVTIAECAHVHSSAQPSWNVYNLPRTATAEISTELDESWLCVCLRTILLQSLVSPGAPEISFPSALVVFSLFVSSESYLLSQGGKFSIGVFFEQDLLLSLSAKITFVTISFPSVLVVFSLCVSSESYLLSQGGKSSFGTRVAMLRDVYCLRSYRRHRAWAVSHVGACVAHHTEQARTVERQSGFQASRLVFSS